MNRHQVTIGERFEHLSEAVTRLSGTTGAFITALGVIVVWALLGPIFNFSDTWQLVINTGTTIITFLMVFLIQNTQNREGEALQTKLDELIRAVQDAENRFIGLERRSEREITTSFAPLSATM